MNILQSKLDPCPACGLTRHIVGVTKEACSHECVRASAGHIMHMDSMGHKSTPHMHVKCNACKFEWLEAVYNEEEVKRAW